VFQNYALFPHLNVFDNVAFGMRTGQGRVERRECERRTREALEMVQLSEYGNSRPVALSGGQQQRVALARTLVLQPACLLLDEPLGALDAKLRKQLQVELKTLQERVGITFIYVTHDQDEALTMSDRIAVMNGGQVEQLGTPREIYETPRTTFVADFLGASNLMDGEIRGQDGEGRTRVDISGVEVVSNHRDHGLSGTVKVTVRPEKVGLDAPGPKAEAGENEIGGTVEREFYLGNAMALRVNLDNGVTVESEIHSTGQTTAPRPGDRVRVYLPPEAVRVLSPSPVGDATDAAIAPVAAQVTAGRG